MTTREELDEARNLLAQNIGRIGFQLDYDVAEQYRQEALKALAVLGNYAMHSFIDKIKLQPYQKTLVEELKKNPSMFVEMHMGKTRQGFKGELSAFEEGLEDQRKMVFHNPGSKTDKGLIIIDEAGEMPEDQWNKIKDLKLDKSRAIMNLKRPLGRLGDAVYQKTDEEILPNFKFTTEEKTDEESN